MEAPVSSLNHRSSYFDRGRLFVGVQLLTVVSVNIASSEMRRRMVSMRDLSSG